MGADVLNCSHDGIEGVSLAAWAVSEHEAHLQGAKSHFQPFIWHVPIITLSSHVVLGWRSPLSRGIEVVPIQVVCSSLAAFSLLALLYKGVAEHRGPGGVLSKDKRKGRKERRKEKETEDWRDSVLAEGLKKSDAGSVPCTLLLVRLGVALLCWAVASCPAVGWP